jgi:2,3-bisphosphoglycerate-independent phosphoglycerate mutase
MAKAPLSPVFPVVLVILDGWGYRESRQANAIAVANTPIMDTFWQVYPKTLINTSGNDVGLPEGQMGNSEVGHLNLGAGRIVPQELVRITNAVKDKSLLQNPALVKICQEVRSRQKKLHLIGLCSDGGVHSHITHLLGLLDLAKYHGVTEVCIHVITDGRDTNPNDGVNIIAEIEKNIQEKAIGKIATVSGRYYAMDRDHRWDRVGKAYEVMAIKGPKDGRTALEVVQDSYNKDEPITDEFIIPTRISGDVVESGDGVIFFNFRPDRARELTSAFISPDFSGFPREKIADLSFVTFTQYDPTLPVGVAFEAQNLTNILGEIISKKGLKQLRTAETEKYPHVTYFFNGGLEEPFEGEDRVLIQSPMVTTYDKAPAMSAVEVTDKACAAIAKGVYSLVVINYANPDMVGHTGMMDKAVMAVETVDSCLGRLSETVLKMGGTMLITADHGNAEYMKDDLGNPWTAHTTNPVPFILIEGEGLKIPGHGTEVELREGGCLADIAPTILEILNIPQPEEMTGKSLIKPSLVKFNQNRTPVKISL